MTSNLITVQDTMSVSVPVTYEGEQDAISMFPSKNLFKHGDNALVPSLSQEFAFGVSKLSEIEKDSGKSFKSITDAKKEIDDMNVQFTLNGVKMTLGQYELNKPLPDKYKDYTRVFRRKMLKQLLDDIARNESGDVFQRVIDRYKDLGALYAYKVGGTISIEDAVIDRSYRDKILKEEKPKIDKIKDPTKKLDAYMKMMKKLENAQNEALKGNRMLELIDTGALSASKAGNVRQVLTAPGITINSKGQPNPIPIERSYSEGLDSFDYFNTLAGVRKGTVDKAVNTRESGALNKTLLSVNRRLLITDEDCNTAEGLELSLGDKDVMDRTMLITVPGVAKRNEIIDSEVINRAKAKNLKTLKVRSPLTCKSVQGVCQKCYGTLPNGQLPAVGVNVGVLESQALTERATQLTLQTFHTGGAAGSGNTGVVGSFPRLEQLLKVPEKLSGKATLSKISGTVTSVDKNEIGGWDIFVNSTKHVVPPGREPVVSKGSKVKRGDRLSDGSIKPQELGDLKDHLTAQRYIVDEISNIYGGDFHKKTMETVIRGVADNAVVTKAPDDAGLFRGDKTSKSYLEDLNKQRTAEGLEPIEFKPYFKSIDTLNVDNEDWLTRVTTNRVKDGLARGMAKGSWANIAGKDPIPAYIYGDYFGMPEKKRKDGKGFY